MNIKILADSSANLHHLEGVNFESVPLKISTDEREFVDDINLDVYEMATYLANYKGASRTSCPNVGEWLEAFGDADIVYCVTIISTLSGSYNFFAYCVEVFAFKNKVSYFFYNKFWFRTC